MSGFAWSQTRTDAPPSLTQIVLAGLVAYVGPAILGGGLTGLGRAIGAERDGGALFMIGFVLIYVPLLSWIGLLPGMLLHWLAWRKGRGGLLTCLLIAALIGALLTRILGGLALILGVPVAALYWFALRALAPDSLRAAPETAAG